jgi:hypothetical protein
MKPNWTFDRPTEPGEYWLALRPEIRPEVYAELDVMPPPVMEASGLGADGVLDGFWWGDAKAHRVPATIGVPRHMRPKSLGVCSFIQNGKGMCEANAFVSRQQSRQQCRHAKQGKGC